MSSSTRCRRVPSLDFQRANGLRRAVVNTLYTEMLIPDFRGDVLRLLTHLYGLLTLLKRSGRRRNHDLWVTRAGLPASTTQAVVEAIVGWNWFSGSITNLSQLSRIVAPVRGRALAVGGGRHPPHPPPPAAARRQPARGPDPGRGVRLLQP